MIFRTVLLTVLLIQTGPLPGAEAGDDFPTLARVEYVLACMKIHGRETYDSLYGCVCAIDYIRSQFSYEEYSEAEVYRQLRSSPGERGGLFRDPDQADTLREKFAQVNETAEKRCFMGKAATTH